MIFDSLLNEFDTNSSYKALFFNKIKTPFRFLSIIYILLFSSNLIFFKEFSFSFLTMMAITGVYIISVIITYNRYIKKYDYSFLKLMKGEKNIKLIDIMTKKVQVYLERNSLYKIAILDSLIKELTDYIRIKKSDLAFLGIITAFIIFIISVLINIVKPEFIITREEFYLLLFGLGALIFLIYVFNLMHKDIRYSKHKRYKELLRIIKELYNRLMIEEHNKNKK